ncbi:hypothetical protein VTI74DRAFT_5664 [Chaetomium olivicolor]
MHQKPLPCPWLSSGLTHAIAPALSGWGLDGVCGRVTPDYPVICLFLFLSLSLPSSWLCTNPAGLNPILWASFVPLFPEASFPSGRDTEPTH